MILISLLFNVSAPNPSSTQDKGVLGAAPPGGGSADPLTDPDNGFYENLPFHGMQSPPNKVRTPYNNSFFEAFKILRCLFVFCHAFSYMLRSHRENSEFLELYSCVLLYFTSKYDNLLVVRFYFCCYSD